ncbi:MAG: hypothetical protein ABR506_00160, partial [Candidatus Krumholzibacteriia bacterium]
MRSRVFILAAALLVVAAVPAAAQLGHAEAPRTGAHALATSSCVQCHTCDKPTAAEPCLAACPRHGGHFYGSHD